MYPAFSPVYPIIAFCGRRREEFSFPSLYIANSVGRIASVRRGIRPLLWFYYSSLQSIFLAEKTAPGSYAAMMWINIEIGAPWRAIFDKFARKSQYEAQFRKWKWNKNEKKEDWGTIFAVLSRRERQNKKSNVFIRGTLQQPARVRKRIAPHAIPIPQQLSSSQFNVRSSKSL